MRLVEVIEIDGKTYLDAEQFCETLRAVIETARVVAPPMSDEIEVEMDQALDRIGEEWKEGSCARVPPIDALCAVEARGRACRSTIGLKRSTPNLQLSTRTRADYPSLDHFADSSRTSREVREVPTTDIGATILSRRTHEKTSRLRLGARPFSDTTPADVEVTGNSIGSGRHASCIVKKLSDVMNEGLAVPRRM